MKSSSNPDSLQFEFYHDHNQLLLKNVSANYVGVIVANCKIQQNENEMRDPGQARPRYIYPYIPFFYLCTMYHLLLFEPQSHK